MDTLLRNEMNRVLSKTAYKNKTSISDMLPLIKDKAIMTELYKMREGFRRDRLGDNKSQVAYYLTFDCSNKVHELFNNLGLSKSEIIETAVDLLINNFNSDYDKSDLIELSHPSDDDSAISNNKE